MAARTKNAPGQLITALQKVREAVPDRTIQAIAKEAGVAPATLRRVLDGTFVPADAATNSDKRAKRGWIEALARLADYASGSQVAGAAVSPEVAVSEAGFELDEDARVAIGRATATRKSRAGLSDLVLNNITDRPRISSDPADSEYHGIIHVGVLQWRPFSSPTLSESWGHKFCARLLGSLNPKEWRPKIFERHSIAECLARLVDPSRFSDHQFDDVVFGVYDTVSRRLAGIKFLAVPGIGVPLYAIYYRRPGTIQTVHWNDIATPPAATEKQFRALVLDGEVGELYLRGPCQYHPSNVVTLNEFDPKNLARVLSTYKFEDDRTYVFVADRPTCRSVLEEIEAALKNNPAEEIKGRLKNLVPVSTENASIPAYRLGLSFRAEAKIWCDLLETALIEELFRNDLSWTVAQYAELLHSHDMISLIPLEPPLHPTIAKLFATKMFERLNEDVRPGERELSRDAKFKLITDMKKMWGLPESINSK